MKQVTILLIVYIVILVVVVICYHKFSTRGYARRVLSDITPCPFGKVKYFPVETIGDDTHAKGLVCYSLYGNYKKYAPTLYKQLEDIQIELPDWTARVYTPIDVDSHVVDNITSRGGVVIKMNGGQSQQEAEAPGAPQIGIKGHEGAVWRFLGAMQTKPFICLDADDVLYNDIAGKIKKWLKSRKTFFIFKPWEILLPMAAGRWGGRGIKTKAGLRPPIPEMLDIINEYCEFWFGFDEALLKNRIARIVNRHGVYKTIYWPINELIVFAIIALIIAGVITLATARRLDSEIQVCRAE